MRFLANENVPIASVKFLIDKGYDVISIGELFPGITDDSVMKLAIEENRTILTFDSDYGELIFQRNYHPPAGVIYYRLDEFEPAEPGEYLVKLLISANVNFKNTLTVIDKNSIRQRKY